MGLFGNIKKRANAQTSHALSNFLAGRKIAPIVEFELLGDQDRGNTQWPAIGKTVMDENSSNRRIS